MWIVIIFHIYVVCIIHRIRIMRQWLCGAHGTLSHYALNEPVVWHNETNYCDFDRKREITFSRYMYVAFCMSLRGIPIGSFICRHSRGRWFLNNAAEWILKICWLYIRKGINWLNFGLVLEKKKTQSWSSAVEYSSETAIFG